MDLILESLIGNLLMRACFDCVSQTQPEQANSGSMPYTRCLDLNTLCKDGWAQVCCAHTDKVLESARDVGPV